MVRLGVGIMSKNVYMSKVEKIEWKTETEIV